MPVNFMRKHPMTVVLAVGGVAVLAVLLTMVNGGLLKSQVSQVGGNCEQLEADLANLRQEQTSMIEAVGEDYQRKSELQDQYSMLLSVHQYDEEADPEVLQQLDDLLIQINALQESINEKEAVIQQTYDAINSTQAELDECGATPSMEEVAQESETASPSDFYWGGSQEVADDGDDPFNPGCVVHYDTLDPADAQCIGKITTSIEGETCSSDNVLAERVTPTSCTQVTGAVFDRFKAYNCNTLCNNAGRGGGTCEVTRFDGRFGDGSVNNSYCDIINKRGQRIEEASAYCACDQRATPSPSESEAVSYQESSTPSPFDEEYYASIESYEPSPEPTDSNNSFWDYWF